MTQDTAFLERLQKLIAKEESAREIGSYAEAEAFAAKVQELLVKYNISKAEVDNHKPDYDPVDLTVIEPDDTLARRVGWINLLAGAVANGTFCRYLVYKGSTKISFVGKQTDREVAVFLFTMLRRMIRDYSDGYYYKYVRELKMRGLGAVHAKGYKETWITGAITALWARLDKTIVETSGGSSIVLVSGEAIRKWFDEKKIKNADKLTASKIVNLDGWQDGKKWGNEVPIHNGLVAGDEGQPAPYALNVEQAARRALYA